MGIEQAPSKQRDSHRLEVTGTHRIPERTAIRLGIASRTRLKMHAIAVVKVSAQRQLAGEPGLGDTRDLAYRLQSLLEEPVSCVVVESGTRCLYLHRKQMQRIEPGINREQMLQATQQQSGAHQQHEGERDFGHNQSSAQPLVTTSGSMRALLQSELQVPARRMQRRNKPDHHPDHCRDSERESEDCAVNANRAYPRQSGWTERHKRPYTEFRDDHSKRAAQYGKQQALGEQLPNHPRSSRAQRDSYRKLAASLCPASQQQIRHISGGDREHQHDRAKYGEQRRFDAARNVILQRVHYQPRIHRRVWRSREFRLRIVRD